MGTYIEITSREKKMLQALARYGSTRKTAEFLGVSEQAVRNMLYRLRRRYSRALRLVSEYRQWREKMPPGRFL